MNEVQPNNEHPLLALSRQIQERLDEQYLRYEGAWSAPDGRLPIIDRVDSVNPADPCIDHAAAESALMRHLDLSGQARRPVRWFDDPEPACAYMLGVTIDAAASVAHLDGCGHDIIGHAVWASVNDSGWLESSTRQSGGDRMEYAMAIATAIQTPTVRAWKSDEAYETAYCRKHAREHAWYVATRAAKSRADARCLGTTGSADHRVLRDIVGRFRRWIERRRLLPYSSGTQAFAWNTVLASAHSAEAKAWMGIYATVAGFGYPDNALVRWNREVWSPFADALAAGLFVFWVRDREIVALSAPSIHMSGNEIHREGGSAIEWAHECYY